ncbi:hypothetical protein SDC9_66358 [bioreactor metagenome]|uniref:Uncharacterized protein n=1 Tax=bioreactor metagenome TaxID=1076179 RepID=A0A644XW92_9ZZZZ
MMGADDYRDAFGQSRPLQNQLPSQSMRRCTGIDKAIISLYWQSAKVKAFKNPFVEIP